MENKNTDEKVKEIKQSFRQLMNGVTAQSLRDKGLDYHLNWGASLMHLKEMAQEYEPDYDLALKLWKDDVRECKILATMLMPAEDFPFDLAMLWVEQTRTQEIAEIAAMNLYQFLPYASDMAFILIASPDRMMQLQGYNIIARLFAQNKIPSDRDTNEFVDQAVSVLQEDDLPVKHAALNAMQRFADIDETCRLMAKSALKTIKMDDWL